MPVAVPSVKELIACLDKLLEGVKDQERSMWGVVVTLADAERAAEKAKRGPVTDLEENVNRMLLAIRRNKEILKESLDEADDMFAVLMEMRDALRGSLARWRKTVL